MVQRLARYCLIVLLAGLLAVPAGCRSPYHADRGALAGGLAGAGVGALVGHAVGNTGAGAAIGAGVGALTGGAVGGALDDIEARNRAEIATHLGRPVTQGAATMHEVVAMHQAGVDSQLIVNYVNGSGMAEPVTAQDVIYLHQQGVPTGVIQAMQSPATPAGPVQVVSAPPPIIVEEHYHGRPFYFGPPPFRQRHRHGPRVGWGISFSN